VRVAVITGASSGIGRATAWEFVRRGYSVAVLARRLAVLEGLVTELKAKYPQQKVIALQTNVTKYPEVAQAAETIESQFGKINVLVNNAGAFDYKPLQESTPEKLDEMIDVNVRGLAYVTKAMLPLLRKGAPEWAKVVNVSSLSGLWGFSNMSVYTATKFAVAGFSSGLRRELGPHGIGVSTIFPGPVNNKVLSKKEVKDPKINKLIMYPDQIARQIYDLAVTHRKNRISHPAFAVLHALEKLSPKMVDRLFKLMT
jgi:3-hydroxy acid dehydrogenase / malonic semialdehyde reductase